MPDKFDASTESDKENDRERYRESEGERLVECGRMLCRHCAAMLVAQLIRAGVYAAYT